MNPAEFSQMDVKMVQMLDRYIVKNKLSKKKHSVLLGSNAEKMYICEGKSKKNNIDKV